MNPGARDSDALRCAAYQGHPAVVRTLLALPPARGVDPGARDNDALRYAAHNGHTAVVNDALGWAAFMRCTAVLRLLLLPRAVPVPAATLARLQHQAHVRTVYTAARWDGAGMCHARGRLLTLRLVARRRS